MTIIKTTRKRIPSGTQMIKVRTQNQPIAIQPVALRIISAIQIKVPIPTPTLLLLLLK